MTLFERVKKIAGDRGYSLAELARKANIGEKSIYAWKPSKTYPQGITPRRETLDKVADVLHVSVDYLLGNTDNPNPPKKSGKPQTVDLHDQMNDDLTITAWKGRTISPEEREMIRRILDGGGD